MNIFEQTVLIALGSLVAGFLGALTGLGGGVIIVPMLTLVFKADIHYAIGASLVSVIATSSGAASAYVKEGFTNIRIGMFLETATVVGAIIGASLAPWIPVHWLSILFGLVLLHSAYLSKRAHAIEVVSHEPDSLAGRLRLDSAYPRVDGTIQPYHVQSVPKGYGIMLLAGALSGLLGIGSGALKVIAMDQTMKIPFKVSTTTSNFMIGVTAAASAGIYLHRGYIAPGLAMPVLLGVLIGSLIGSVLLSKVKSHALRYVFSLVILLLGVEMILDGITGRF